MSLQAAPEHAGKSVRCPGCNAKLQVPAGAEEQAPPPAEDAAPTSSAASSTAAPQRQGWVESDHANVNIWMGLGFGAMIMALVVGCLYPLRETGIGRVFFVGGSGFVVNLCELLFFSWAIGIIILKYQAAHRQRDALLLDLLPQDFGKDIDPQNVGTFIDYVYELPHRIRDSFMVNRIRKALEFFERRPNNGETAFLMQAQSDIDNNRIAGSYSLLKVFLWAIPILGFIGTVLGLSESIAGLGEVDPDKLKEAIGGVTAGLGTAFNTTLLGLVLAILLSFPIAAMQKIEEDNLTVIDAYCNENLLTRLSDGAGLGGGDAVGAADSIAKAVSSSQREFLADLNELSATVQGQARKLEERADTHQQKVEEEFSAAVTKVARDTSDALKNSTESSSKYLSALDEGIRSLNKVLGELGEKGVVVQQVKKKGWFR